MASREHAKADRPTPVGQIMQRDLITIRPNTPTLEAIELMKTKRVGCLPITVEQRLVGVVTEHDFLRVASMLLEQRLREDEQA
jgi:CBS domain-containing protein